MIQRRLSDRSLFRSVPRKVTLSLLIGLLGTAVTSPGWALCVGRTSFGGTWSSWWYNAAGEKFESSLNITTTPRGISGTYDNGVLNGSYVNGDRTVVNGTWRRTQGSSGGACPYGRFRFTLSHGDIFGLWSYCNKEPRWKWRATVPCDDSMHWKAPLDVQVADERSLP